jgi:eukaryotic-like serine/threonine-protein kinase
MNDCSADPIDSIGQFGLYRPEEIIGRGSMATVLRATSPEGKAVAVKVIRADLGGVSLKALADQEARASVLRHPHIVRVLGQGIVGPATADRRADWGPAGELLRRCELLSGCPYFVLELVEGKDAASVAGKLDWPELRRLLLGVLCALQYAHGRGILHRDLKPQNILLPARGRGMAVKIIDWGICWDVAAGSSNSFHDQVAGTPATMSPEQVERRWQDYGPWTDLYAVGCLTWWLVTGRGPFNQRSAAKTMAEHVKTRPGPMPTTGVPEALAGWVARLLAKPIAERPQSAREATSELLAIGGMQ